MRPALGFAAAVAVTAWLLALALPVLVARSRLRAAGGRFPGPVPGSGASRERRLWGALRKAIGLHTPREGAAGGALGTGDASRAEALEALLVAVVAGLQAGRPLRQAWLLAAQEVAAASLEPGRTEFIAGLHGGWSLEEGLAYWHRRSGSQALRRCQAVAAAHRRTGGDVQDAMLAVIRALREHRLARAELGARTADARLSARLLAFLPLAVAGYGLTLDPVFFRPLIEEPLGRVALLYGCGSWAAGIGLLRRVLGSLDAGEGW